MLRHKYDLFMDDRIVGKADVVNEGLYYVIKCTFSLDHDGIYRAIVQTDHECLNLGICVPEGDLFAATVRIPVSKIENDDVRFYIVSIDAKRAQGHPVSEDAPFDFLELLYAARFSKINGKPSIFIAVQKPEG